MKHPAGRWCCSETQGQARAGAASCRVMKMSAKLSEWKKSLKGREGRKKRSRYWKHKSLGSRGDVITKLKRKGIHEGQHREWCRKLSFDPTWKTSHSLDVDRSAN